MAGEPGQPEWVFPRKAAEALVQAELKQGIRPIMHYHTYGNPSGTLLFFALEKLEAQIMEH